MLNFLNPKISWPIHFIRSLIVLFLVEFVRGAILISYLPAYGVDQLHISLSVVGIAITVHYLTDTAIKGFIGYLLDHFPFRLVVQGGLFISFIGLIAIPFSFQAWLLILSSAVFGIGISAIWIVCLSKVQEENRATQMGLLYMFWFIGMGLGPICFNFLIDWSYRFSFWVLVILWGIGWFFSLGVANENTTRMEQVPFLIQWQRLWNRLKMMRGLIPGMILQTMAAGMLVPILPHFVTKQIGLTYSQYSYLLIIGGASVVLGLIPMGKLSDLYGGKWFLVLGFGIFAISLYGLTLSPSFYLSMVWSMVLGISYAAVLPTWNALLSHYVPSEQQGLGWGIFSSVEGIGVIIGPVIGGWIAAWFNDFATVWVSAALLGSIAVFYCFFPFRFLQD
jgi:MFS family permease